MVKVVVALLIDAVTNNEPVFTTAPEPVSTVTVNVEASPLVNVITLLTALAVVNNDAVDTVVPAFKANEAVVAYEELTACEAEVANNADIATEAELAL